MILALRRSVQEGQRDANSQCGVGEKNDYRTKRAWCPVLILPLVSLRRHRRAETLTDRFTHRAASNSHSGASVKGVRLTGHRLRVRAHEDTPESFFALVRRGCIRARLEFRLEAAVPSEP